MTVDDAFIVRLRRALAGPLPGAASRREFAPELSYGRHDCPPMWDSRAAAVLFLLYPDRAGWRLPFTLRPATLSTHSGQVSLPGGEIEPGESPEEAAARELGEELGVVPADLEFLGRLTPVFVYASNFGVTPCVAACTSRPPFVPNPDEVANLIEPAVVDLLDPTSHGVRQMSRRGLEFQAPEVIAEGHSIWGATCLMLAEFCAVACDILNNSPENGGPP